MQSCIYRGWVRHRRFGRPEHDFRYRLFMLFLDLAELERLRGRLLLWSARRFAPVRSSSLSKHVLPSFPATSKMLPTGARFGARL